MIATAMSRRSLRAAGGLRRLSESHTLPTFPLTIYLMMCGGLTSQWTCETDFSPMQRRTKDPKTTSSINRRNPTSCYIPSASAKIELFHIILLSQQFWP